MQGWYEFPRYLQHPDGRVLKTAAYILEHKGHTTLAEELRRMADQLLSVPPHKKD